MKKLFTLFFAVMASVGTMFAELVISVNDNSIADWNTLPSEYVFEATCPSGALWTGLHKIKVYADQESINYMLVFDPASMPSHTPYDFMHIYINADNSSSTGGFWDLFAPERLGDIDLMFEGALWDDNGNKVSYRPEVSYWNGTLNGDGWNWDYQSTSDFGGGSQFVGDSIIEGRLIKANIPWRSWSDKFSIGFAIQQNYENVGLLPQASSPNGELIGRAQKLEVTFDSSSPSSSSPTTAAPSNSDLAQYYDSGQVCVCIYVPDSIACNPIVLTGSFNNWSETVSHCVPFVSVTGHDGWYVASFAPEDQPDATKGIQAKPIMLDADGNFNWEYQPSSATIYRGDFSIVQASDADGLDFWHLSAASPNVMLINAWHTNPCSLSSSNEYTILAVKLPSENCPDSIEVIGDFDNWKGTSMELLEIGWWLTQLQVKASQSFMFRSAGSWDKQLEYYDAADDVWKVLDSNKFIFGQLWNDDSWKGVECKMIEIDLSDPEYFRWTGTTSTTDGDIPSDAVLAQYCDSGQVCVCIYVPVEIACNDIVLVGSFNGWNATVSECPLFRPVAGYDGWYVTSFIPEDQPDATKGIQAKPVILDADGRFSWDYQVGAATVVGGGVQMVAGLPGEIDLINYGTDAPNVLTIEAWKSNPCTAIYHNYTITVVNEGCDGLAVPFITGSMTNWSFTQMEKNTKLWLYGIPAYSYSFKAPEGSSYQLLNGLADTTGTIIEAPDWSNEASYLQKYVDGEWVRMPGDEGTNLLTKDDEDIVYDLRDTTVYRWARCAPSEEQNPESEYQDYTILLYDPVCEDNPEFSPALFLNGDFVGFEKTLYGDREVWYARVEAVPGTSCHIVEMNHTFGNEIQQFDSTTQQWWGMMPSTFPYGTSADGTTLLYDYSNTELYRYALCGKLGYDDSTLVNMTVKFKAPSGAPEKVALVGNFVSNNGNSWVDGVLMTYKNGFYTATVKATMNGQFKFKEYADDINYIYYTNGTSLENFVFGEYMDDLGTVTVDLSDDSRYKWKVWSDYKPIEIYSITVQADNTENGTVRGGGEYKEGETAVIMATPRKDCTFAGWNDGNTLNPRSILVTGDAEYTAIFRRNIPLPVVVCSDTMYFTSADSIMIATRVYAPSQIEDYDQLIIATVNNKNVMGFQFVEDAELRNFRTAVEYTKNMPITNVSVVEVVPNGGNYRLRVADGELAPRCEDCTSATNQLYATQVGADWYFAQYDNSVLPEAAAYANRMILYNEEAPRFSSYRQVTGLNRSQTTVFKLHTPRNIPQIPEEIPEDTVSMVEEEKPMEDIPVNIEPKDTVAVISTPYVEYVHSFTLIVWADEAQTQVLVMITYDSEGNQLSITRPSAIRRLPAVNTDITFEINELKPSKTYHYTLIACEDDGSILTSLNSSFETATTASGIQDLSADPSQPLKILRNGQILILRAGKLYTLTGQEVK